MNIRERTKIAKKILLEQVTKIYEDAVIKNFRLDRDVFIFNIIGVSKDDGKIENEQFFVFDDEIEKYGEN